MSKVKVLAEPGCTAEGHFDQMMRLIEVAASAGCDVFKPQWTSDARLMCERRHIGRDHPRRAYYERAYSWLEFPLGWHAEFREQCKALGMSYACTAFLAQDVFALEPFVDYLKVSSFEARDVTIQTACKHISKPVIVSTGMMDGSECFAWRQFVLHAQFLHCVSAYPAPLPAMNIMAIDTKGLDGLSDHSRHLLTGALAVACGAEIVEAHYRLDDCSPDNPDYAVAFTPAEFTQYIQNIRDAETLLGSGVKQVQECEQAMLPYRVGV
jgi:sialic acid synthase SpsE